MAAVLVTPIQFEVFLYKDRWSRGYGKVLIKAQIAPLTAVWFEIRYGDSRRDTSAAVRAVGSVYVPTGTAKSVVDQPAVQLFAHWQARIDKHADRDALGQVIAALGRRGVE